MTTAFALSFLVGIGLAVIAMLAGVERRVPATDARTISVRFSRPILSAFFLGFGALGYILARATALGPGWLFGLAAIGGAVMVTLAILTIAAWAVPSAKRDVPDARFELQGFLAQVLEPMEGERAGRVRYEIDGRAHDLRAVSLEGSFIPEASDVVIERVEDGVAYVELWEQVERRLQG